MKQQIKKIIVILLSVAIGIGLFAWLVGIAGFNDIVNIFKNFPPLPLVYFFVVSFSINGFLALRWQLILKHLGHKIKFLNILVYREMGYAVSYVTPSAHVGGEPVRALMLKRQNVKTTEAFSSVILDKAFELTADIIFGAIGMLFLLVAFQVPKFSYLLIFIALAITIFIVVKFFVNLKKNKRMTAKLLTKFNLNKFKVIRVAMDKIDDVEKSMSFFMRKDLKGFYTAISISIFLWGLMYLEYFFALRLVGIRPTLAQIFLVGVFIALSYMIPVPGALGVLEAGQVSAFAILGFTPDTAIAFSLVIRARDFIKTFIGLALLSHQGINFIQFFRLKKLKR